MTAFHVVEHLPFERLDRRWSTTRTRVLQPGGLLMLETPNPTNLVVGASSFYLDPTHCRPVPPPLLHFALWSRGFDPIEVRYLNPPAERLEPPAELVGDRRQLGGRVRPPQRAAVRAERLLRHRAARRTGELSRCRS